jgi:hypothetical protein
MMLNQFLRFSYFGPNSACLNFAEGANAQLLHLLQKWEGGLNCHDDL